MLEGQNISHYELSEKLGEGGMGVVYKAWDRKLNRFVALKFLSGSWANSAEQVTRFQLEAQAISALNHPNIATIYEIDEAQGHCFLALEYLPGGTLKTALDQLAAAGQQLSVEQGLEYALQLTEAVAHAHSHGVIHRDIKSANALFTETGAVKLTDFGLAKLARGINVTQSGSVMGTPASMSPEQARGQATDERSDVFSLGVIMFELFSGELPFRGENSLAVLHQIVNVTAPLLGQRRSGIPVALERIVSKALERDRAERYQSAASLAADLRTLRRELLFGSSVQRSSLETVAIGTAPVRRRRGPRLKRTLAVAAACVVLGSAAWLAWPAVRTYTVSWFRAQSLPAEKRLAILPFSVVGGGEKEQTYADGLREVLISRLMRLEQGGSLLVVLSPDEVDAKEIGSPAEAWKRLGANLVVTGKVLQSVEKPELYVDLHDPQRSAVLDSTKIDVSNPDLSAAAEALVRLLELGLNSQERQDLQAEVSSKADATRSYVEGRGYLLRRDRGDKLDLAAVDFREAVESDPDYAVAWAGLAEAVWQKYKTQGEARLLEESAGYAQRALGINKRLASVHIVMGQIRRAQKNYPAASEELQAALALEPANARALRALGDLNQDTGKFDDAERAYNKAVEIRQGDAEGHINLGAFYRVRQRLPEAQVSFARAVDLAPDSYLAHNNLGVVYLQEKKYQDAIDEFKKSLAIAPNARAYNNEGAAHYSLGHYTDAALAYAEAVKLADKRSIYVGNLAEAYLLAHVPDKARDAYRTAIKLLNAEIKSDPGNADLHARIALYYSHLPNRNLALREIRDALSRNSTASSDVQFKAVLVYEELGEHKMAMEIVRALYQAGHPPPEIQTSPFLERLRHDPEFLHMASPRF